MSKKYELVMNDSIDIDGSTLYRIKALKSFNDVKVGDLGGYIQGEHNLSHDGNCWVYDNARVYGNAEVFDNAEVYGNAEVSNDAKVYDDAKVYGNAIVHDNAEVYGYAEVYNYVEVHDNAEVYGYAEVYNYVEVHDNARVSGNAEVYDNARVYGNTLIDGNAKISNNADISSDSDYLCIEGLGSQNRSITTFKEFNGGIHVNCGCFEGTLDEFETKVNDRHGDNKYGKEYKLLIDMCKVHFNS